MYGNKNKRSNARNSYARSDDSVHFGNGVGYLIKSLRKEKGIGKMKLANQAKIDVVYLDLIERNKKKVCIDVLVRISNALDYPVLEFGKYRME